MSSSLAKALTLASTPQRGPKSRVACFCKAAPTLVNCAGVIFSVSPTKARFLFNINYSFFWMIPFYKKSCRRVKKKTAVMIWHCWQFRANEQLLELVTQWPAKANQLLYCGLDFRKCRRLG